MINELNEIKDAESEKLILDKRNDIFRNTLADQLLNKGLGEKMINQLKNPITPTKFQVFKTKVKRFFNNLFEVL